MRFVETPITGAYVIEDEPVGDERGWFARTFDADVFRAEGLEPAVVQCSTSYNGIEGTLRGMHYQEAPHGEVKLVRCTSGAIYDVIVDLRRDSDSYCEWFAAELTPEARKSLYAPIGVAHGFQTLAPGSTVHYQMGQPYVPNAARGVRWDDPAFGIRWPDAPNGRVISDADRAHPDFQP
jgi:dTDP-4-dehydrorhamnose 3,5-epimerase